MTGKMTNTIRPSTGSLRLPHVSDLIHLKPHMDGQCSGAVDPLKWQSLKNKSKRASQPVFSCSPPHPTAQLLECRSATGILPDCVKLWSYGYGPRSKFCQLLMLGKLLNFPELHFLVRNTTSPHGAAGRVGWSDAHWGSGDREGGKPYSFYHFVVVVVIAYFTEDNVPNVHLYWNLSLFLSFLRLNKTLLYTLHFIRPFIYW